MSQYTMTLLERAIARCQSIAIREQNIIYVDLQRAIMESAHCGETLAKIAITVWRKSGNLYKGKNGRYFWTDEPIARTVKEPEIKQVSVTAVNKKFALNPEMWTSTLQAVA